MYFECSALERLYNHSLSIKDRERTHDCLHAEEVPYNRLERIPEDEHEDVLPADRPISNRRAEQVDERSAGDHEDLHRHAFRACRRLKAFGGIQRLKWRVLFVCVSERHCKQVSEAPVW